MAYILSTDFTLMYDVNRICELLSDDLNGTPIDPTTLGTNVTLAALMAQASAMFDSAALVDDRYQPADLATAASTYTNTQLGAVGALIRRTVGNLTWGLLVARRGYSEEELGNQAPLYKDALQFLEELRLGERILNIDAAPQAGLPSTQFLGVNWNCSYPAIINKYRMFGQFLGGNGWPNNGGGGCCGGFGS